jgi:NAD(P)-dependent dehydrogenase (short-subunit alcohol dehydrogenase family)
VVITGAASPRGIGRATAHRLARSGWHVGLIDRDAAVRNVAEEIQLAAGVPAVGAIADVRDPDAVHAAVDLIRESLPPIAGLVTLAGISSPTPYLEVTHEEWSRVIGVNLDGVHLVTQAVARIMTEQRAGRIVTISSVSAQRGGGTYSRTPYSAAKAALIGFTRSLARELGPFDITVNAIAPGPIDTDIMGGPLTDERKSAMVAEQFIKRIGTVDDVAGVIDFLLGPDASFITGQTINVNGGLYLS